MNSSINVRFPLYRYHPPIGGSGGRVSTLKFYAAPYPVRDDWQAIKMRLAGDRLKYLQSGHHGTDGLGLLKSWEYFCVADVAPGGLLDAKGRHIPVLGYLGQEMPRNAFVDFFAGFGEIAGLRYQHKFYFGEPEQLTLSQFKSKLIAEMKKEKGFPKPIKKVDQAKSFLEVMAVEFGEERAKHFNKEYSLPNWLDG